MDRETVMMPLKEYFLKDGYVENRDVLTKDGEGRPEYWNGSRIESSRYYQFAVYQYAKRIIREQGISRVIDVGCGVAVKLAMLHDTLPEVEFVGVDQEAAIEYCRRHYAFGEWHAVDLARPDEASFVGSAGLIICADVIEHLRDPDLLLECLRRWTAPGGQIVLATPDRDLVRGRGCLHCPNPYHIREWNSREFARYVSSRGFSVEDHFLQYPVRIAPNRIFWNEVVARLLRGKAVRYNQVCRLRAA